MALVLEKRPCGDCKHYHDMGAYNIDICRLKLMGVTKGLLVTYEKSKGSCFEPKK